MSTRDRRRPAHGHWPPLNQLLQLLALCLASSLLLMLPSFTYAYPSGPGAGACASGASSQKPAHPGTFQSSVAPFRVELAGGGSSYKPGETVDVTISATDGGRFSGFMLSAFREGDTAGATRLGSFASGGEVTTRCAGQAATHSSSAAKSTVLMQWTAPAAGTGSLILQATVLRAFTTYWKLPGLRLTEFVEPAPALTPTPPVEPIPAPTPEPTPPAPIPPEPSTPVSSTGSAGPVTPVPAGPPSNPTELLVVDAEVGADKQSSITLRFTTPAAQQGIASYLLEMRTSQPQQLDTDRHDDDDDDDDADADDDGRRNRRRGGSRDEDNRAPSSAALTAETPFTAVRSIPAVTGQSSYDAAVAGLSPNTAYTFRVRSSSATGVFGDSNASTVTATTSSLSAALPPAPTVPATAVLSVFPSGAVLIDMRPLVASASASPQDLIGHELQWKESPSSDFTSQPLFVPIARSSAELGGVTRASVEGKDLRLRIRAKSMRGDSAWSAEMSPTTSTAPSPDPSIIVSACPSDCSGRGQCIAPDGVCDCDPGSLGPDCASKSQLGSGDEDDQAVGVRCFGTGFCLDYGFDESDPTAAHFRLVIPGSGWAGLLFDSSDGMSGGDGFYFVRFPGAKPSDPASTIGAAIHASSRSTPAELPESAADASVSSSAASFSNSTHTTYIFRKTIAARPALWAPQTGLAEKQGPQRVSYAFGSTADFVQHRDADCGRLLVDFEAGTIVASTQPRLERVYASMIGAVGAVLLLGFIFSRVDRARFSSIGNLFLQKRVGVWSGHKSDSVLSALSLDVVSTVQDLLWGEAGVLSLYAVGVAVFIAMGYEEFPRAGLPGMFTWGHLAAAHWALVLLPVSKNSAWAWVMGSSFERLVRYHRMLGRAALAATYTHMGCMLYEFGGTDRAVIQYGVCALAFFTAAAAVAFEPIRRAYWGVFIVVHVTGAVVGYVFACLHVKYAWWFSILPLSLWLIDMALRYVIRPFLLYNVTVVDARALDEHGGCETGALVPVGAPRFSAPADGDAETDNETACVEMTALQSQAASSVGATSSPLISRVSRLTLDVTGFPRSFEPGSYCLLNIPVCSLYQFHPFSISNCPSASSDPSAPTRLTLHILAASGWSRDLYNELQNGGGSRLRVHVDGPYGKLQVDLQRYSKIVLVAGGIGITPLLSTLLYLHQQLTTSNSAFVGLRAVHLVWACRGGSSFQGWGREALQRVQSGPHADKFHLHLYDTLALSGSAKQPELITHAALPSTPPIPSPSQQQHQDPEQAIAVQPQQSALANQAVASSPQLQITPGRPDLAKLMESLGSSVASLSPEQLPPNHAARHSGVRAHSVAVLACGPPGLVAEAQREALARGFHFHKETFVL